ncbi:3'-5' exonuclease [Caenispirillum bisanense]
MDFRIADTFTAALQRLTAQEQKAVKTTAFDLQLDPSAPGLSFHRVERSKDPDFWSVRVNADLRLIVHKTADSLLLCHVGHHDEAYAWAERRRIDRHPATGAAQLVTVPERVEEARASRRRQVIGQPAAPVQPAFDPPRFLALSAEDILGVGVPPDWVEAVHTAGESRFFDLAEHLPAEAVEALLDYMATGVLPSPAAATDPDADPFDHPDARRRFRVLETSGELERALDYPWEKWTVFLHPAQRDVVERTYGGPARVGGSAGTGKTIVALHRAVFLARRQEGTRVLLTTFSKALANALKGKLRCLVGNEPDVAGRITVQAVNALAYDLHTRMFGQPNIAPASVIQALLTQAVKAEEEARFSARFLAGEWADVVDAWQLRTWEEYRDVARLGRRTRLGGRQREALWAIFSRVRAGLAERGMVTWADVFGRVTERLGRDGPVFDCAVIDEAQDVGVAELRFLAALAGGGPDALFFTGDLGQRIFQQPFSWKSLGVDVRGRSHSLRINYRTSHQIRSLADRLLPAALADVDGNTESRAGAVSLFDGPPPQVETFADEEEEAKAVAYWAMDLLEEGVAPDEIAVFVRSDAQMRRARAAMKAAGIPAVELDEKVETAVGHASLSTMHIAKGLEFRAVAVMACDDEVIPSPERIAAVADDADLEEVYDTERHLLYVACTRARDHLLVTGWSRGRSSWGISEGAAGEAAQAGTRTALGLQSRVKSVVATMGQILCDPMRRRDGG